MQALRQTWDTIVGRWKLLTPTARLLVGSLGVILLMSLFLISLYAKRPNLVPLGLGANVSAEARSRTAAYLTSNRITYETAGNDYLVPADQKMTVWGFLTESQLVAGDQINFDRLMGDDSPFRSSQQNRQRYLVAKMNLLSAMVSQMTGVERATVVLDVPEGSAAISRAHVASSASVTVLPRGSELSQQQVDAIARLVAGSQAGLKAQNVSVIDARTNRALMARTEESIAAGKYMEVKLDAERHVKSTIENALGYINGVLVAVNAQVDTKQVVEHNQTYDEPKLGPVEDESHSITSSAGSGAAEPGVRPNTGMSIASSSRSSSQLVDERTRVATVPFVGGSTRKINDTKGYALQINASIGVPKSYFVRLFQDQTGQAERMPETAELDALVQRETDRIKTHISPLIDTRAVSGAVPGTLSVSMIPDFSSPPGERAVAELASTGGGLFSQQMIKYVGIGGLAAVSLLAMFLMVRKVGASQHLPTAAELMGIPPALAGADAEVVGEAAEAATVLDGIELNDDAVRRQQMLKQITDMITAGPDDAAQLLRRWAKAESY